MNIREIANEINEKSKEYRIGKFQDLRKEIKGLSKRKSSTIFTNHTISEEGWAYHSGGSQELHFSIGLEKEGLRYGVGISLQINARLPDLSISFSKILKLNSLIRNEPNLFMDYKMWYWQEKRSKINEVQEINDSLTKNGTYIFIGKLMDIENIDFDKILSTFDDMLNIYEAVENNQIEKDLILK